MKEILPLGINLFTFDFSGCGNSQGDIVTHGWKETDDLLAVLNWLAEYQKVSKVLFWGESMGGATALLFKHTKSPIPIAGMIIDSAYCNLREVVQGIVGKMLPGITPESGMEDLWPPAVQRIAAVTAENFKNPKACDLEKTYLVTNHITRT